MSEAEMASCDALVMIPMSGNAESLNVASAATVTASAVKGEICTAENLTK